ncbi:MAG: helix-turn-helix transcriptional regulator [Prolixibacteraceae bacterium]|jgi:DNA-binding XRE family transcriptional regulator|nr:helix-turn-helix transcriptional regulator [Prolixibacteraceae bacterium]
MRQNIKIPRILKINWIRELSISVVFNNGESRIIDFRKVLKQLNVDKNSPANILFNSNEFTKIELVDNTLSWNNVEQYITMRNGEKMKVPYEIGADVLLKFSHPEKSEISLRLGQMVREARLKKGLTQQDLALKSGTSRTYISRIENDRSDLELATLRKIIETGLGKRLEISIK